jgi:hypothetical protein
MLPPVFPRFKASAGHVALQLQPRSIAKLDRRASESCGDIDAFDVHAGSDALNIDTVMTLEVAKNSMVCDPAHGRLLKKHHQFTASATVMRTIAPASMVAS